MADISWSVLAFLVDAFPKLKTFYLWHKFLWQCQKTVHGVWPPVQSASWFLQTAHGVAVWKHFQNSKMWKSLFKAPWQVSFDLNRTSSAIRLRCSLVFRICRRENLRGQGEEIGATTEKVTWFWSFTVWGGKCLLGVAFFVVFTRQVCGCFFSRCSCSEHFFCWEILF